MEKITRGFRKLDSSSKLLVVASIFGLPAYVLFFSSGNFNWMIGMDQLYNFESLYAPEFPRGSNPYGAKIYPYLPNFAVINAIIALPGYLLISFFLEPPSPTDGSLANYLFVAIGLIVTGFWSYLSVILIPYISSKLYRNKYISFWSVVVFVSLPLVWHQVFNSGVNTLVALLALVGIWYVKEERWLIAGVAVGLSTFKFNGLPFGVVLFLYALFASGYYSSLLVTAGGIISQIPNILYFIVFPSDLLMIIERGGALTAHGHTLDGRLFLTPIVELGLSEIYTNYYLLVVLFFSILGTIVAIKSNGGLPAGFAIGFFSTSFLAPGEQRIIPFVILLLIILLPLWITDIGKILTGLVVTATTYDFFVPYTRGTSTLGLTSAEHAGALGITNGAGLVNNFMFILLPIVFFTTLFLLEEYNIDELSSLGISQ
jgi:hypothetical protein